MRRLRVFLAAFGALALAVPLLVLSPASAQVSIYGAAARTGDGFIQQRALNKLGSRISPVNTAWYWDDFNGSVLGNAIAPNWRSVVVGTGAGSFGLIDEAGGVHQLTSGATAASSIVHTTDSPWMRAGGTVPWYFAHRTKVTTAITAQTILYVGIQNLGATKTIGCGVFGANNTTNFVCQYDGNETGTFVDLGTAVDTAYHTYEVWAYGDAKIHCSIDFGVDKCAGATMSAAATDSHAAIRVARNGADAVARAMRGDWLAMVAKRN